jgi:ABC-2 type transport system permease protein
MSAFLTLVRRELGASFNSLTGYVVIAVTLLLTGFSLVDICSKLVSLPDDRPVTETFYQSAYFWVILLVVSPVITMRTFAAEKSSGTYEALMTTPVSDTQVVLAKFTGSLLFFAFTWLPLLAVLITLRQVSGQAEFMAPKVTAIAFLGVLLIGSLFMAMGCFASSLTRSQVIAAMMSFLLGVGIWVVSLRPSMENPTAGVWGRVFDHLSIVRHMEDFSRGVLDSRHLVFYLTSTALFVFLTQRVVESRRWK